MNYWEQRANERMAEYHKDSNKTISLINSAYDKALEDINDDIERILFTFMKRHNLSRGEAIALMNKKISIKEIASLKDKIARVRDEEIKALLIAELESKAYGARISVKEALKESILVNIKSIATDTELILSTKQYENIIKNVYRKTIFDIQKGLNMGFSVSDMSNKRVQEILKQNWSGKHYSKRIWDNTDVLVDKLQKTLINGTLTGKSTHKMLDELSSLTEYGKYAAERLIRTETTYISNQATIDGYKECGIDKYVFVATLDSRTSETCREHDGKIYEVKKAMAGDNLPPLHVNCRSTTISYMDEEWLKNLQRRAKDPETGKTYVVKNMNYKEWEKKYVKS